MRGEQREGRVVTKRWIGVLPNLRVRRFCVDMTPRTRRRTRKTGASAHQQGVMVKAVVASTFSQHAGRSRPFKGGSFGGCVSTMLFATPI
jgi:hypothetical protein